jgi:hypothetical protein
VIKRVFTWLITSIAGHAIIGNIVKVALLATFVTAVTMAGLLPRSPFSMVRPILVYMIDRIPYFRYVSFFLPVAPIMGLLAYWLSAIVSFHVLKVILRQANILK